MSEMNRTDTNAPEVDPEVSDDAGEELTDEERAALLAFDEAEANTEANDEEDDDEEDEETADVVAPRVFEGMDSEERVRLMANAADAVRASDLEVLDLRSLTIIADFFLICTGNSSIQLRAIADRIEDKLRDQGIRKLRIEGYNEATWILLDYGDVVAHIMAAEQRDFYSLEEFWNEAPRLELDLTPEPTSLNAPARFVSLNPPDAP